MPALVVPGTTALAESIQHTSTYHAIWSITIDHHAIMYMLHAQANDISVEHSKYCPTVCSFESILLCIAHAATTNKDFVTTDNIMRFIFIRWWQRQQQRFIWQRRCGGVLVPIIVIVSIINSISRQERTSPGDVLFLWQQRRIRQRRICGGEPFLSVVRIRWRGKI